MDTNNLYFTGNTSPEQREIANSVPTILGTGELPDIDAELNEFFNVTKEVTKQSVPIYELKAEEEARAKLKNHKNEAEYEALVARVKEWESILADKDELDHMALAVLLDDRVLFNELKRSHKTLDDTWSYITKETNKWEQHEAAYDSLLNDIYEETAKCEEAKAMLSRLM